MARLSGAQKLEQMRAAGNGCESKIWLLYLLSASLGMLSANWQLKYDHPIYLAETFVECERLRETCYRAPTNSLPIVKIFEKS
jgi:hypothetical protein